MVWDYDSELKFVDPDEPYREYWFRLGRFIHEFSAIEQTMQELLRAVTGLSDPIGASVFSGTRANEAMNLINRICDATDNAKLRGELAEPFRQLGEINGVRNNVVHWGVEASGDGLLVSNRYFSHAPHSLREYQVSPKDLSAMTVDLIKIGAHLKAAEMRLKGRQANRQLWERVEKTLLEAPWLYRPPQQSPPKKERRQKAPKQRRQPAASQD